MAEDVLSDSLPDLRELENKLGRKTPESLLMWMRDAADCGDCWSSDAVRTGDQAADTFADKLKTLKEEMRCLRCADVRILRQLVAVHEGIEAMRWLMEERGTFASRGSSLTGSLSSLVTAEEAGYSPSPFRDTPSPICPQVLTEEDSADQPPHTDDGPSANRSHFDMQRPESAEVRPAALKSGADCSSQAATGAAHSLLASAFPKSWKSDSVTSQDTKTGTDPIRRALLRSCRAARKDKAGTNSLATTRQSTEPPRLKYEEEEEEDDSACSSKEKALLGYDAQWCWVESQDDVTFL